MTALVDHGTTRDGLIQLRRRWLPTTTGRAAVLLIHGLGEHCGRYEHVGRRLAEAGLDVIAIDNRGFGETGGRRGHVDSWDDYLNDVEDQLAEVRTLGLPTVMMGHSLGGLIALSYCGSGRPQPDALVTSGPALGLHPDPKLGVLKVLGPIIRRVAPNLVIDDNLDETAFAEDLSVGKVFMVDPLRTPFFTISLGMELFGSIDRTKKALLGIDLPLLCMHGGRDKLVPTASSEVLEDLPGAERTVYDDLGHEIFNEPVGLEIVDTVIDWIERTLKLAPR